MDTVYHLMFNIVLKINTTLHFWAGAGPVLRVKVQLKPIHVGPTSTASLSISVITCLDDSE
jgi:hypothetical protein